MQAPPVVDAPVVAAAPVSESQRNRLIDALRGVALLGILLMNIPGFAMPNLFSESFRNDPTNVNFWVNAVVTVVFEGKMRALFGMIFGAGVVLFVCKKERTGKSVTGLFYRRMFWLAVFGLIHAHLILWVGDILYLYGVCGMIVYLFRNVRPVYLALGVPLVAVFDFGAGTLFYQHVRSQRLAYVEARDAEAANRPLSAAQTEALAQWRELEQTFIPNREEARENTRKMKSDYATVAAYVRRLALKIETVFLPLMVWDSIALMLLGIALYRWGFLTGEWSNRAYLRTLLIGYGTGLPLVTFSFYHGYVTAPDHEASLRRMELVAVDWVGLIYPFQRILLVLAHVSALVLLYKSGRAARLFRRLEAVGQMAFTNYITHSVLCTLIFFGYGLNYYLGKQDCH
ncbi:DUF418 domain-containing protein [Frigoriglobus tundricola]|uniref:DUF418 domain-containing protein n=1 Tax=Frigoriglobus tundricola TaxID=2774151 RepID=A0A6M5YMN0_9BACT|nr:DUF418 domain-containing protein [Frigoriglobus tundricola]QJW94596.1 hypothetical protein FTUN_2117 [Frigoriglobus tundricola]